MIQRLQGCFRNLFAGVGCVAVLVVGGFAAWEYRAHLDDWYRWTAARVRRVVAGRPPTSAGGVASAAALRAAQRKESAMARPDDPAYVVLTADEVASLIAVRLEPLPRTALDSLQVVLADGRFGLAAQLSTEGLSAAALGPLAEFVGPTQPVRLAGPVRILGRGRLGWEPDEVVIRAIPLPRAAVTRLVEHLTGDARGVFIITVPETVGDVRVRVDGVTFYRRTE